jgi:hypothetical protein
MEPEGALLRSQEPAIFLYPEPAHSGPHIHFILSSHLCSLLHFPVTSYLLGPIILLSTTAS